MRIIFYILTFLVLTSCLKIKTNETSQISDKLFKLPEIQVMTATFPLYLSQLDFENEKHTLVSLIENEKIQNTIHDYYFNECLVDSILTNSIIEGVYFKTIQLKIEHLTVYLILFRHYPSGRVNCKILLFDNISKKFYNNTLDFNIHGLYNINQNKLEQSNLKEKFKIDSPEIEFIDFDKDGIKELKTTRLYHNGTANAIETTIIKISENTIDTIDFKQKWVGLCTENP